MIGSMEFPSSTDEKGDPMEDFMAQVDALMDEWRENFRKSHGREPTGEEENAYYETLRNSPSEERKNMDGVEPFDPDSPF